MTDRGGKEAEMPHPALGPRRTEPAAGPGYGERPFILIWETTQACRLACRHCRASAIPWRATDELDTREGRALLDAAAEMGVHVVVLSGGDPLARDDLLELIRHGREAGLRMSTIPAATSQLTREAVAGLRDAGLAQMALSLDAPTAEAHDAFRGVPGAFVRTLEAAAWARELGLPLQINSVICRQTWPRFAGLVERVRELEPVFWEVFFLVPVGRGAVLESLDADEFEEAFGRIHRVAQRVPFIVKVVEAPHYHRYCLQHADGATGRARWQGQASGATGPEAGPRSVVAGITRPESGPPVLDGAAARRHGAAVGRAPAPVNAGRGFCFVSFRGEVFPSGFLPLSAGNVRHDPLARIYRDSDLFRSLRDPDRLRGKCGVCPFRAVCGGSRSRAFALSGDPLGPEPCCAYEPPPTRSPGSAALRGG